MPPAPAPAPQRTDSYLICATPRTGSSLLCGLLDSTGVAGHPESWFRRQDELEFAARWGIADASEGTFGYSDYFRAAVAAGSTANGAFAARIMWGTMDEVTAHLASVHPGHTGSAAGLLSAAFGRTRFVYLRRGDVVAQAVSLLRAEQTGVWFETADERQEAAAEPGFDFGQVRDLVRQIENENAAWEGWFTTEGIQPYRVLYEELDDDPVGIASGVLGFLGLDLPAGREITARHKRLADELNARWVESYRLHEARERQGRGRAGPGRRLPGLPGGCQGRPGVQEHEAKLSGHGIGKVVFRGPVVP
jgi:LPS sulfotransferase NodH